MTFEDVYDRIEDRIIELKRERDRLDALIMELGSLLPDRGELQEHDEGNEETVEKEPATRPSPSRNGAHRANGTAKKSRRRFSPEERRKILANALKSGPKTVDAIRNMDLGIHYSTIIKDLEECSWFHKPQPRGPWELTETGRAATD